MKKVYRWLARCLKKRLVSVCAKAGHPGTLQQRKTLPRDVLRAGERGVTVTPTGDYHYYCERCGLDLGRVPNKEPN